MRLNDLRRGSEQCARASPLSRKYEETSSSIDGMARSKVTLRSEDLDEKDLRKESRTIVVELSIHCAVYASCNYQL